MASAAGVDPALLGMGLRSGSGAWEGGGGGGDSGGAGPSAAPAERGTQEPTVDLAKHPSGIVPTLQ